MGVLGDYFKFLAGVTQAKTDKENAQLQYDAAMKQIEAQKEANAEQQAFNKQESELAFQRNSSLGQLKQLMAAGLSEAQARQVIAGGSTGAYTAAPSVNQNQGVDYTAPAAAQAAMNQADTNLLNTAYQLGADVVSQGTIGAIDALYSTGPIKIAESGFSIGANILQSSLGASNGGVVGSLTAGRLQSFVAQHINEIPDYARGSYASFCDYANSAAAPGWMKTSDFQQALQSASSNPFGIKSMREFFDTSNQLLTGEQHWKGLVQDVRNKQVKERLDIASEAYKQRSLDLLAAQINNTDFQSDLLEQKIESEKLEQRQILSQCISQELQNQLFKDQLPYISDATKAELLAVTSEFTAQNECWNSGYFTQTYMDAFEHSLEAKSAAAVLAAMNDQKTKERIEKTPSLAWLVEMHNALKGAGFQIVNSTAGAAGAGAFLLKAIKYVPK